MSVSCCDPKKEPKPQDPNSFKLLSRRWTSVSVSVPSLVVPAGVPAGKIFAYPTRFPSGTPTDAARYTPVSGIAPLLPTAGEWAVYNNGTTDLSVTVLDARDASTVQTYQKPGYVTVTHTAPTVSAGPASTAGLVGNVLAKYRLLVNDSSNNIYLNMGGTAVVNTGVRLNSGGGSLELYGPSMFYGPINFISSNAGDVLLCTESE